MTDTRVESDSMGEVTLPVDALYGAQTQRAINNFSISRLTMPTEFIHALALVKEVCAETNHSLGLMQSDVAAAIITAAQKIQAGEFSNQFPVDVFQTGSGTSTNMNMNEVMASLASLELGRPVHPNDDINLGQSSNDVIPTTLHVSASTAINLRLLPSLEALTSTILAKAAETRQVKTGRTHLMDAMPITFEQELGGWASQIQLCTEGIQQAARHLLALAQGGTAVGTGINAHPDFGARFAATLAKKTGLAFSASGNYFASLSSVDTVVSVSGQLKTLSVALLKIANDLRWMNSGPLAGIAEIELEALQPGSSIMPGKVNPVIPEAVAMAAAQVIGSDATITIAGQSGNFQLNVMLPVVAHNLLESIQLLANAADHLGDKAIRSFKVNEANVQQSLARNPILATALNPVIGYNAAAKIAKTAYAEQRPVIDVAEQMTDLSRAELEQLLDPARLTLGGLADEQ